MLKNIDNHVMLQISQKMPLQRDNLFENIYNLYKGIASKDITQWLGSENIKDNKIFKSLAKQILKENEKNNKQ